MKAITESQELLKQKCPLSYIGHFQVKELAMPVGRVARRCAAPSESYRVADDKPHSLARRSNTGFMMTHRHIHE